MVIVVRGQEVCSFCKSDLAKAAQTAGLKKLDIIDAEGKVLRRWMSG